MGRRTMVPLPKKVPATLNAPFAPKSTPELNAKLASMGAAAGQTLGGDTLELDAGTYVVTETIKVPPHVDLVGLSRAGTVLQAGPSMTGPLIQALATSSRRFAVRNLTLYGAGRPVLGAHLNTPSVGGQEYADGMYNLEALDILNCGPVIPAPSDSRSALAAWSGRRPACRGLCCIGDRGGPGPSRSHGCGRSPSWSWSFGSQSPVLLGRQRSGRPDPQASG